MYVRIYVEYTALLINVCDIVYSAEPFHTYILYINACIGKMEMYSNRKAVLCVKEKFERMLLVVKRYAGAFICCVYGTAISLHANV